MTLKLGDRVIATTPKWAPYDEGEVERIDGDTVWIDFGFDGDMRPITARVSAKSVSVKRTKTCSRCGTEVASFQPAVMPTNAGPFACASCWELIKDDHDGHAG